MKTQTAFERLRATTNQAWFSGGFVALRITIGLQFLLAGIAKFDGWSATGYLSSATGPFAAIFQSMAGNVLVDQLNIWGLTLIGLALIVGLAVRPASFFAAILMVLYYFAQFTDNTAHGYIDDHIIYAIIFVFFMAGGAGHVFGLDSIMSRYLPKKKKLAALLFG